MYKETDLQVSFVNSTKMHKMAWQCNQLNNGTITNTQPIATQK
jgi:hypothetical protein